MFLIAGESLIDMVPTATGDFTPVAGGAPFNFARALALQGVAASYANPFSDDAFGLLLKRTLEEAGATHLGRISSKPTSLAFVSTDERGHPQYSFYREGVADRDVDAATLIGLGSPDLGGFHAGALALVPPDDRYVLAAVEHFRGRGVLCTVDVNMRPRVAQSLGIEPSRYRDAALEVIGKAHVVKASDEDLAYLGYSGAPERCARALLGRGPRLVVVTLGAEGAWAVSAEEQVFQSAEKVRVVDTVGAGDCFFAGFVASLYREGPLSQLRERSPPAPILKKALRHASICAAINISRWGCRPPTWEEAERWQGGLTSRE
jgi:fructokinase